MAHLEATNIILISFKPGRVLKCKSIWLKLESLNYTVLLMTQSRSLDSEVVIMTYGNNTMTQTIFPITRSLDAPTITDKIKKILFQVCVCVCVCVCEHRLECFLSSCVGLVISFLACSLTLDVKVIGAFGHSLSISVNVCVCVCVCVRVYVCVTVSVFWRMAKPLLCAQPALKQLVIH